jgi:CheY-like chemotaxis protein
VLSVSDNGIGMDKQTLEDLFEPFFTTKDTYQGTGLGLATVYGIVKQNKGLINVYSEPGQGTVFKIYLQAHKDAREEIQEHEPAPDRIHAAGPATILLVEDEDQILEMTQAMLQRLGYQVIAASSPGQAMAVAAENPSAIDLMITDVIMPEMNGRALADKLKTACPGLKCLFMSGYTADVIAHHGVLEKDFEFIQKPFTMNELGARLREILES